MGLRVPEGLDSIIIVVGIVAAAGTGRWVGNWELSCPVTNRKQRENFSSGVF